MLTYGKIIASLSFIIYEISLLLSPQTGMCPVCSNMEDFPIRKDMPLLEDIFKT